MNRTTNLAWIGLLLFGMSCAACSSGSKAPVGSGPGGGGGDQMCTGVCASSSAFTCTSSYATSACLGGNCCILAPDAGPPDAGSCQGLCASPDDIACPGGWTRSSDCFGGDLCCGGGSDAGDGG